MAEQYEKQQHQKAHPVHIKPEKQIAKVLSTICYDHRTLTLHQIEQRDNGLWLVDIAVHCLRQ